MKSVQAEQITKIIEKNNLDGILFTGENNRFWISNFSSTLGYIVSTREKNILLVDGRYYEMAVQNAKNVDEVILFKKAIPTIKDVLEKLNIKRLGLEESVVTMHEATTFREKLHPIKTFGVNAQRMRMIKSENEIKDLQEAAKITDQVFAHICKNIRTGMTEKEAAAIMYNYSRKFGADKESFEFIIASNERSILPHGVASDKIIKKNDFITLDFGVKYKHYCSDMTRNIFMGEEKNLNDRHADLFKTVREAQLVGIKEIKPGVKCCDVDKAVRVFLAEKGYNKYFTHGLGHGLGLEVHEAPYLNSIDDEMLVEGMVVTVEPGIYIKGVGGARIEDDIVVNAAGGYSLNKSSRDLVFVNND